MAQVLPFQHFIASCIVDLTPKTASFWVAQRPDLIPSGVAVIRHSSLEEAWWGHQLPFTQDLRYTRYPTAPLGACVEGTPSSPSEGHVQFLLRNEGDAPFESQPGGNGSLPLHVSLYDGARHLGAWTVDVRVGVGEETRVMLNGSLLSLVNRIGLLRLRLSVDPQDEYREWSETNNAASTPADPAGPEAFVIRAPDLTGRIQEVRYSQNPPLLEGTVLLRNIGDAPAGAASLQDPVCKSRDGAPVRTAVYLDNDLVGWLHTTLPAGSAASVNFTFGAPGIDPGSHAVLVVVDPFNGEVDQVTERREDNNRHAVPLEVPG
jgi:hypothetical protein